MEELKKNKVGTTCGYHPNSVANLVQNRADIPHERVVEFAKKANAASTASRRRRKSLKQVLDDILALEVSEEELKELLVSQGLPPTNDYAVGIAAVRRAKGGDIEAARFVRDSAGDKLAENMNLGIHDKPIQALDLTKLSDDELLMLMDGLEHGENN